MHSLFVLLVVLPAMVVAAPKPGDEGTPEYRAAIELVKELGNARFNVREAAAKKLLEMCDTAIPALVAGTKSADEEIRNRSATLLPQVQATVWNRRADAFLADGERKQKTDLPLLADWETMVGKLDAGSRKLFADMVRANGSLLELAQTDRKEAVAALAKRSSILLDTSRQKGKQVEAPASHVASLLFMQEVLKDQPDTSGASDRNKPLYLLANPSVAKALDAKDIGPAYRRLMVQWAESRPSQETMSGLFFALLTHRHPFPEANPHLIRLATSRTNVQLRWVAMEALGKSKEKDAVGKLTELLADKTAMYDNLDNSNAGHEVRDCALAALISGLGKKLSEYGLTSFMVANFWAGGEADTISLHLCGFKSAADRERGMKKWQAETTSTK